MVDAYIQYYSTKQQNTRVDSLADILNNITKNSMAYATVQRQRTKNNIVPKQQIAAGKHVQMV